MESPSTPTSADTESLFVSSASGSPESPIVMQRPMSNPLSDFVVWALKYTDEIIDEKREKKNRAAEAAVTAAKDDNEVPAEAGNSTDVDPSNGTAPDDKEKNHNDNARKQRGKPKRPTQHRIKAGSYLTWVPVQIHGHPPPDAILARRPVPEDLDFGPFHQPANFKPDVLKDLFILDRSVLGQWAAAYLADLFRAKTVDVRSGARDAAPVWLAKLKHVAFVCSDAASMFRYLVAIVNIRYPPIYNNTPAQLFAAFKDMGRTITFLSAPFRCHHEECAELFRDFTTSMRVVGSKSVEGCLWWAFCDLCFDSKTTICIRDFPHPKDILFAKGVSLAAADTVAAWNVSVLLHVASLPDLREPDEPPPDVWGRAETAPAPDPRRYLGIYEPHHESKLAKLVVREGAGCNTAAHHELAGMPAQFRDMIANTQLCPVCGTNFFGPGCRFTIHGGPALPHPEGANLSFIHYGCHHDHRQFCELHASCVAGRNEAMTKATLGWKDLELAATMKKTLTKPRAPRKRKTMTTAAEAASAEEETEPTAKEAEEEEEEEAKDEAGDGDVRSSAVVAAGVGAGPSPQKRVKRTPEELAAFIDAESLGPRFRGTGNRDTATNAAANTIAPMPMPTNSIAHASHSSAARVPAITTTAATTATATATADATSEISRANDSIANASTAGISATSLARSSAIVVDSEAAGQGQGQGQGQDDEEEDIYN